MINIAEILKNCPAGTKLYSPAIGECTLNKVLKDNNIIHVNMNSDASDSYFNEYGQLYFGIGECLLFPSKDNRDWNAFKKFHSFKPFDKIVARFRPGNTWQADFFSHWINKIDCQGTSGNFYGEVLPFNEETSKLIGTCKGYE